MLRPTLTGTHKDWEISQVSISAIINLNNDLVTFIIADTNAALHKRPGVHQRSCAIQPSMGRDTERGTDIQKKKKKDLVLLHHHQRLLQGGKQQPSTQLEVPSELRPSSAEK